MKAKIKCEWMGRNENGKVVPCKFEEDVILSNKMGFNKKTYYGWYVSDDDLDENGVYRKYWHHDYSWYKNGLLNDFDVSVCRKIIKSSLS